MLRLTLQIPGSHQQVYFVAWVIVDLELATGTDCLNLQPACFFSYMEYGVQRVFLFVEEMSSKISNDAAFLLV